MDNLNLFSHDDISEDWKEGKHSRHSGLAIYDKERDIVDFEPICKISDATSALVCVRDDHDLVASVNELGRELVDMTFDSSRLGEEEVADHCDIVRHLGQLTSAMA